MPEVVMGLGKGGGGGRGGRGVLRSGIVLLLHISVLVFNNKDQKSRNQKIFKLKAYYLSLDFRPLPNEVTKG